MCIKKASANASLFNNQTNRSLPAVSSNIPLNSPSHQQVNPTVQAKIESIKAWGISTYKYSRQLISEKLGKSSRTVDLGE